MTNTIATAAMKGSKFGALVKKGAYSVGKWLYLDIL